MYFSKEYNFWCQRSQTISQATGKTRESLSKRLNIGFYMPATDQVGHVVRPLSVKSLLSIGSGQLTVIPRIWWPLVWRSRDTMRRHSAVFSLMHLFFMAALC